MWKSETERVQHENRQLQKEVSDLRNQLHFQNNLLQRMKAHIPLQIAPTLEVSRGVTHVLLTLSAVLFGTSSDLICHFPYCSGI